MQYMTSQGHREIACITQDDEGWVYNSRLKAYQEGLLRVGVEPKPERIAVCFSSEHAQAAAQNLLQEQSQITAAVIPYGNMLPNVLAAARLCGRKIPGHLSLVSVDDTPCARLNHPAITIVRQPLEHLGNMAANPDISRYWIGL